MPRFPYRLERPPLIEALCEVWFGSKQPNVGDLLPGMLYKELSGQYGSIEPLPLASVPLSIRNSNDALKYQPHYRLTGEDGAILLGDRVALFSQSEPYPGWVTFLQKVETFLSTLRNTCLISRTERLALKFVNLFPDVHDAASPLALLNVQLQIGSFTFTRSGLQIRAELEIQNFVSIVELYAQAAVTPMKMAADTVARRGLVLSINTINDQVDPAFLSAPVPHLQAAHNALREIFFSLLRPETLQALGPVQEEE
jgi:uncharacterized protein (TIGR04255 family)